MSPSNQPANRQATTAIATTGDVAASAGHSQTTLSNTQSSQAITGGGNGTATTENQSSAAVTVGSKSNASSGNAAASNASASNAAVSNAAASNAAASNPPAVSSPGGQIGATSSPGGQIGATSSPGGQIGATSGPGGHIGAASGNASATGLASESVVSNSAVASVQVGGVNEAPISVRSNSTVSIQDTGVASAHSGSSAATDTVDSPVVAEAIGGAVPSSSPVAATGLTAQTNVAHSFETSKVVPGGTTSQGPISITQTQSVSVTAGGSGTATSGAVCDGLSCGASTGATAPGTGSPSRAQAASGTADAHGLVDKTSVVTDAAASVSITGRNFAPIKIIIDAIASITNWGSARAESGAAASSGGLVGESPASTPAAQPPSVVGSGDARATGAQLSNHVDLSSSASVHVAGDNHSPINIILGLAANLLNWGVAGASSGNAQTSSPASQSTGTSTATTGSASATGLQVENAVTLKAYASVAIDGDNYAPIVIWIHFDTAVDNRGWADAATGAVRAGSATSAPSSGAANLVPTPPGAVASSAPGPNASISGPAMTIGDTVTVGVSSHQSASANGASSSQATDPSTLAKPAVTAAAASTSSPISQAAPTSIPTPGSLAVSGAAVAAGMQASVDLYNSQISVCATSNIGCSAANGAGLAVQAGPAPSVGPAVPTIPPPLNGGGGSAGTGAGSGGSGGTGEGGGNASQPFTGNSSSSRQQSATLAPMGSTVFVDPWVDAPGRRLPPLPKQRARAATGVVSSQDLWGAWPSAEAPPIPGLASTPSAPPAEAAGVQTSPVASTADGARRGRTSTAPSAIDELEPDAQPPLTLVEMDSWMVWPEPGGLPVPRQAVLTNPPPSGPAPSINQPIVREPIANEPIANEPIVGEPIVGEPTPLAPFALGGVGLLAVIGATTRRGRRWLVHQWRHWLEGAP